MADDTPATEPSTDILVEKTIINARTTIKGEIHFAGPALICGRVEGHIRADDELEISLDGYVQGDIVGTLINLQGTVKGNVTATQTARLGPSARLAGELRAANLAIAEGATFVGKIHVGGEAPAAPAEQAPPNPAAVLQSRLASLGAESEEPAPEPAANIRVSSGVIQNSLKRAPVILRAH